MTKALIPNPLQSDSQYDRYYHYDIPYLKLDELHEELYALRPLLWGLPETDWIRQRVKELETEIAKRRYSGDQPIKAKPKPKQLAEGVKL